MGNLNLTTVELVSTLRQAPTNGPTNSQDYNDSQTEVLADLASISGFINDLLIPMLDGLSLTIQPINVTAPHGLEGRYIFSDTSDLTTIFFDSLSNQPLSVAESLRTLQGIVKAVQVTVANLNVEITSLQTQLSSTNQNDIAQALQNFAASLQSLTAQVVANTEGISNNSSTLGKQQQARLTTGAVTNGTPVTVPVSFPIAYVDNNYTFNVTLEDASGFLSVSKIQKVAAGVGISALITNSDAGGPHTGVLHLTGFHD